MMLNFAQSGHPGFRATSALERGELKSKGSGKKSIHFNGSEETVEMIFRTDTSVNQLNIHGAIADLCTEFKKPDFAEGEICESLVIPTETANADTVSQSSIQHHWHKWTCCKKTKGNSQNFRMIRNCRNCAPTLVS